MLKELRDTLNILDKINKQKKLVESNEINERYENIEELKLIIEKLNTRLDKLGKSDLNNEKEIADTLLKLHHMYMDFIWHFDQMHEVIVMMIKKYQ